MKTRLVTIIIAGLLGLAACNNNQSANKETPAKTAAAKKYYCTMHPDIGSDKPGTCSKCGMDLVERDTTGINRQL